MFGKINPRDSFQEFNVDNLISLAKLYPSDFFESDIQVILIQWNRENLTLALSLYCWRVRR
jgi:hypothetical protein